jgi:acyl-CoA synthetase (NDP forming)
MSEIERRFQPLFKPKSIAFIGASNNPRKWGFIVLANLINGGFEGPIYPINPKEQKIQGLKAYPSVADLPDTPDLAVIVVPPLAVPSVIDECVAKGVPAGLVITAGFAEVGLDGEKLQGEMVDRARQGNMILVGPNCNGIMRPSSKLFPLMPPVFPSPGPIAVVAQSGNVATSIVRRLMKSGFGCSCYVSSGNEADLHCEDYFNYLAEDSETRVILSYIEGFRDGKRFFEAAKRVTRVKPIIMLKVGGTAAGARAAMSHTASLAGADSAFDGACRQAGVIRAKDIDELRNVGISLFRQPLPQGNRVGIVTAGGGWGVLAADACARAGLDVVTLPDETIAELDGFLPPWWSRSNPVDLVAGLRGDHLMKSLECLLKCEVIDGVILLGIMPALPLKPLPPNPGMDVIKKRINDIMRMTGDVFDQLMGFADSYQKPVIIASELPLVADELERQLAYMLGERGYICYPRPEDAAQVMACLASYGQYLRTGG